jgi:hypothetical protein
LDLPHEPPGQALYGAFSLRGRSCRLYCFGTRLSWSSDLSPGQEIDALNGVSIRFDGAVNEVHGGNIGPGGYNTGLRYQCGVREALLPGKAGPSNARPIWACEVF